MSPLGPGKYDQECETARTSTDAKALLLIVLGGNRGDGFSMTLDLGDPRVLALDVPALLRHTANQIEQSYGKS